MTQPLRLQATATQQLATTGDNNQQQASAGAGFDEHLSEQIDRAESANTSEEAKNTELNQEDNETIVAREGESVEPEVTPEELADAAILQQSDTHLLALQPDESAADNPDETNDSQHQLMPPAGNGLPPVASQPGQPLPAQPAVAIVANQLPQSVAAEQTGAGAISLQQPDAGKLTQTNLNQTQAVAEEISKFDNTEKFVPPEFRLQMKNEVQNTAQNTQHNVASTVASAAALASSLQQVPVSTAIASINAPSATAMGDVSFTSLSGLNSSIATPLQNPGWSNSIAERISWMINGNFQHAELKLNPAHLGPLEIKLAINDDQASVSFVTAHAPVREALDVAMPRLREMLEQQGLNLADVDVSQYSDAESEQADQSTDQDMRGDAELAAADQMKETMISIDVNSGVSIYA
ncbi:MAG: flagellar hook-length control protein FliK [Gammaproteobacteria bacterium]|nr:flagellar hook-length control protein FliK [Gammaproteobacteria bacterium]